MLKKHPSNPAEARSEADFLKLLQELEVHQIELHMQNEELMLAREQAEIEANKYTELYDFAPTAYFTLSRKGEIQEINFSGANLLGKERSLLIGRLFGYFVTTESLPGYDLFLEKVFSSNGKETYELALNRPENQHPHFLLSGIVAENSQQCRVIAIDISERKQTEIYREISRKVLEILNEPGSLKEAIIRILDILKSQTGVNACGIRLKDGDDYPYYAQDGFSQEFLLTENSILGRSREGGICRDPDGKVSLNCTCGMVINGKTDKDNPFLTPGGSIWTNDSLPFLDLPPNEDPRLNPRNQCIHHGFASVALIPIRSRNRNVGLIQFNHRQKGCFTIGIIEHLEEIASHIGEALMRKADEELLHDSHQILSAFMNNAPFFAFVKEVTPTKSIVLKASENYRDMIGIPGSEMIGKNMFELFPPDLAATMTADDWTVLSEDKVIEFGENLNGREFSTLKFPIYSGSKKLLAGYTLDITERKKMESEIQLKNQELKKLNAEKDKYFSIIAHDLRSPFQTLLGMSPMTADELMSLPEEKVKKIAVGMRKSASRLYDLLENLLEWSQIQRGVITYKPYSFLAADAFPRIMELLRETAAKKMIEVGLEVSDDLKVYADEQMFESLIRNFAFNAIKFTPKGGEVNIKAIAMSDNTVHFSISDNGIGMSREMVDKLFLMEEQLTRKGTEGEPSTGLGLIISRDFIEKHGGKLWIESQENIGSTFTFSLPLPVRK